MDLKKNPLVAEDFEQFWSAYPRRQKKVDALKAWVQKMPDIATVLHALSWQVTQAQWRKDDGAFIPLPASWLRSERWEDEPFQVSQPLISDYDWFSECQRLHNRTCNGQYGHSLKMEIEAARKQA